MKAMEIGEVVVFCTFTYVLGVDLRRRGAGAVQSGRHCRAAAPFPVADIGLRSRSACCQRRLVVAAWRKPVTLDRYGLRPPSLPLALAQIAFASADAVLAST
jgi:hypothetical protein